MGDTGGVTDTCIVACASYRVVSHGQFAVRCM